MKVLLRDYNLVVNRLCMRLLSTYSGGGSRPHGGLSGEPGQDVDTWFVAGRTRHLHVERRARHAGVSGHGRLHGDAHTKLFSFGSNFHRTRGRQGR